MKYGEGNVFTRICHSVHKGGSFPQCNGEADPPQKADPTEGKSLRRRNPFFPACTPPHPPPPPKDIRTPLQDTINTRAVCIILESLLVIEVILMTFALAFKGSVDTLFRVPVHNGFPITVKPTNFLLYRNWI